MLKKAFKIFLFFVFVLILLGPKIAPYSIDHAQLSEALRAPSLVHFLGTDANGKDILSLILNSARLSLLISLCVVSLCLLTGLILGFVSGYFGGLADRLFLLLADIFQAFPGILLAISVAAFIQAGLLNLILLLSFVGWVGYARVVRAQVIHLKSSEYVLAARATGVSHARLLWRYFFPNMAGPIIVQASFGMAGVILAESALSFLGLGLPVDTPSLGKLMDSGVSLLLIAPHVSLFPGAVIMLFVLTFNLIGDSLREKLT